MKNIGIIVNRIKDCNLAYTKKVIDAITKYNGNPLVSGLTSDEIDADTVLLLKEDDLISKSDALVSIGGDGTFLKTARISYSRNLPILGINLGSLGFLTEIDKGEIDNAISRVLTDDFIIEERMMLSVTIFSKGKAKYQDIALNDVSIARESISRILSIDTYSNNSHLDSFQGDGLIISTPTGSTAYSLSAGGPIVDPDVKLIIMTPICPHNLHSRPFVTAGDRQVKAVFTESTDQTAVITIDGQVAYNIFGGDHIEVKAADHCVKLLKIKPENYFGILRAKIYNRCEGFMKQNHDC